MMWYTLGIEPRSRNSHPTLIAIRTRTPKAEEKHYKHKRKMLSNRISPVVILQKYFADKSEIVSENIYYLYADLLRKTRTLMKMYLYNIMYRQCPRT